MLEFEKDYLIRKVRESEAANHPYLNHIADGHLTPEQLKGELLERYLASRLSFVPFMASLLFHADSLDDRTLGLRTMLSKNMHEETGNGYVERSHIFDWIRLLNAVGLTQDQINASQPSSATLVYRDQFLRLASGPTAPSLAAFTYALEYFTILEYRKILEGCLLVFPKVEYAALKQLNSHIQHDPLHIREAWTVLQLYQRSPADQGQIDAGVETGLEIKRAYFNARLQGLNLGPVPTPELFKAEGH